MPEPYTFLNLTDFTLGALTGNWAASLIPVVGKSLYEALQSKQGNIPANHDIQRASRQAFANALLVLRDSLQRDSLATIPERDWLSAFSHWAGTLATSLDDGKSPSAADAQHLVAFDKALGSKPDLVATAIGKSEPILGLRAHFHSTVLAWLTAIVPALPEPAASRTIPACLERWLNEGFTFTAPKPALWKRLFSTAQPAKPIRTCLFDVWAQGYFENLKLGRKAFRESVLTAAHDLGEDLAGLEEKIAEHADRAFTQLTAFSGDLAEHARHTRAAFTDIAIANGILTTLVRGLDAKLDAIAAQLTATHDLITSAHGLKLRLTEPARATGEYNEIADLHYTRRWMPELLHRTVEWDRLHAFLYRAEPFLWWGVIGEGGVGKSRIALDLITSAREAGWTAGFLDTQPGSTANPFPERLDLWQPHGDTLVVIDYASFHRTGLPRALRHLAENPHLTGRLRILLLDRPGDLPTVFTTLLSADANANTAALRHCARPGEPRDTPLVEDHDLLDLQPLPPADQLAFLRAVIHRAGIADFTLDDSPEALAKLARATGQGRPLLLTIYALSLIRSGADAATRDSMDALLDEVLRNEIHLRWNALLWGQVAQPEPHPLLPALQRAVAFITMCRGFVVKENAALLRQAAQTVQADDATLYRALRRLLGSTPGNLRPFEPDLLAERFLLNGGIAIPPEDALEEPAKPFHIEDLIPLATTHAPDGMGEMLQLFLRDYEGAALPIIAFTIPHIPPTGITSADGQLLPYEQIKNHLICGLWQAFGAYTILGPSDDPYRIAPSFREWSQRSLPHTYASFVGAALFTELIREFGEQATNDLLASYQNAHVLIPDAVDLPAPFAILASVVAINAMAHYGAAREFWELKKWESTLRDLATRFPDHVTIQTNLAQAATNAISAYGKMQNWDELEKWASTSLDVATRFRDHTEIQTQRAKAAFNAIAEYGSAQEFRKLEQWAGTLRELAMRYPSHAEIQATLATAAVNAIIAYGTEGSVDDVAGWAETLRGAMPEALSGAAQERAWQQIYNVLGDIRRAMPHNAVAALIPELEQRFHFTAAPSIPPEQRQELAAMLQYADTRTPEQLVALESQLAEQGIDLAAFRKMLAP